jgi:hypothetical protein
MRDVSVIGAIVGASDVLMVLTAGSFWLAYRRARRGDARSLVPELAVGVALLWGALWVWFPPLAVLRLAPPPGGQVLAIVSIIAGFAALLFVPAVRAYLGTADLSAFVWMGPWRIVYGAALLLIGIMGGLPAAFFWSAGIGDVLVGAWAITILFRKATVRSTELTLWNAAGLADLLHVLALGAANLRPFYLANPDMPPLNLLPLVGVPLFVGMHILCLWALTRRAGVKHA